MQPGVLSPRPRIQMLALLGPGPMIATHGISEEAVAAGAERSGWRLRERCFRKASRDNFGHDTCESVVNLLW